MAFPLKKPKTNENKICPIAAGYMELPGAVKDGDCRIVDVRGGVSKAQGCCNLFSWDGKEKKFSCGTCEYED